MVTGMPEHLTVEQVCCALAAPLPGMRAQLLMSTHPRILPEDYADRRPPREGAVLVLLYPIDGALHLPLTRRTQHVADHKGQISLPGGARDPGDRSFWDVALREAAEEVGACPGRVQRISALSPLYIPPSNFDIHPYVGYAPERPTFVPNHHEVDVIIELPLEALLDPAAKAEDLWDLHGRTTRVPYYRYGPHVIWGATAMVLSELEMLLTGARGSSSVPLASRPL